MTEFLHFYLEHVTTFGLFLALLLAGLGVPIPEDLILITGGVLAHQGVARLGWMVLLLYLGVLSGDFMIYSVGRQFGAAVLQHPRFARLLTPARRARIEHYFARYGNSTVFLVRHIAVLRVPTYLIAGATKLPRWQFLCWDGLAALISVPVVTGLGYLFANHIEVLQQDLRRFDHWLGVLLVLSIVGYLFVHYLELWGKFRRKDNIGETSDRDLLTLVKKKRDDASS